MKSVIFLFLLSIKGILSKTILLSQQKGSHDNITCGTKRQPCATFSYALLRLTDGGGVMVIDGGHIGTNYKPYIYYPVVININGSLTIRKRSRVNQESVTPSVIVYVTDLKISTKYKYYFVKCSGSLMISSIDFSTSPSFTHISNLYWFYGALMGNLEINNTSFQGISTLQIPSGKVDMLKIKILNTHISTIAVYGKSSSFYLRNVSIKTLNVNMKNDRNEILDSEVSQGILGLTRNFKMTNSMLFAVRVVVLYGNGHFLNCFLSSDPTKPAILSINDSNRTRIEGCVFENVPLQISRSNDITVKNTTLKSLLESNLLTALSIIGCNKVTLNDCLLQNNSSPYSIPSSIEIKSNSLNMYNVTVYESEKDIDFQYKCISKISLKDKIYVKGTIIKCAYGQYINAVTIQATSSFHYSYITCIKCPIGTYTLLSGFFTFATDDHIKCKKCPNSAICNDGLIKSKGGYWGHVKNRHSNDTSLEVTFLQCPAFSCCSTQKTCKSYNTCLPNREGNLCSQCKQGFTCSITNNRMCMRNELCGSKLLNIALYIALALVHLVILLYIREIMLVLKRLVKRSSQHNSEIAITDRTSRLKIMKEKLLMTLRLQNNTNSEPHNDEIEPDIALNERLLPQCFERGDNVHIAVPYQMLLHTDVCAIDYNSTPSVMSGALKVLFFFYQAVIITRVDTSEKYKITLPVFLDFVSSVFNVQPDISYSNVKMCFLRNLQNIHVIMLRHAYIVVMIFFVLFMLSLRKALQIVYNYKLNNPHEQTTTNSKITIRRIDENVGWYNKLPFDVRLKCAYLQILLIGFAGISTFAFQSVYCVKIDEYLYLFIQASISCYQPWQIAIWVFIFTCLIPFSFAVYFASKHLYNCVITPSEFLLIITFPPLFLYNFLKRRHCKNIAITMRDAMLSKHLLMVLSEPFRQNEDGRQICWESILMLRRTILVVIHTFTVSPVHKMFPTVFVLLVFFAHHDITRPYKDSIINTLEKMSLFGLISLSFVNFFWAFVNENEKLMASDMFLLLGNFLLYYELVVLSLPVVSLILVAVVFVVKPLVRVFKKCTSKQE